MGTVKDVGKLKYFYFFHMIGGIANDGDYLWLRLHWQDEADLTRMYGLLGMGTGPVLKENPENTPAFPYENPGRVKIRGIEFYVFLGEKTLNFNLSGGEGNIYEVTETDLAHAAVVEDLLEETGLTERIDYSLEEISRIAPKGRRI